MQFFMSTIFTLFLLLLTEDSLMGNMGMGITTVNAAIIPRRNMDFRAGKRLLSRLEPKYWDKEIDIGTRTRAKIPPAPRGRAIVDDNTNTNTNTNTETTVIGDNNIKVNATRQEPEGRRGEREESYIERMVQPRKEEGHSHPTPTNRPGIVGLGDRSIRYERTHPRDFRMKRFFA